MLTADEKATARVLMAAMRPKLNPAAYGAAVRASRAKHGYERHELVKWHAMHARADQLA